MGKKGKEGIKEATPEQKKNLDELAEDYVKTVFGEEILKEIKERE